MQSDISFQRCGAIMFEDNKAVLSLMGKQKKF